MHRAHRRN